MDTSRYIMLLLFCLPMSIALGQTDCIYKMKVQDEKDNKPLSYVSITFKNPSTNKWEVKFTDDNGWFECPLTIQDTVTFKLSYLGYTGKDVVAWCGGKELWQLAPSSFLLKEIVVTDAFPAIVEKKDTIIYNAASFSNGNEYKLKELLNKMPGLEVNEKNELFFKGEPVKEVLVEGQTFFTGDAALAVKYVPANAVDKIEILEKYNDIKTLAGTGTGDRLALNVALKDGKKQLTVGEVNLASNGNDRHQAHGNLFYFGKKWKVNTIADASTTEQAAISSRELFRIVGFSLNQNDPLGFFNTDAITDLTEMSMMSNITDQQSAFSISQIRRPLGKTGTLEVIGLGVAKEEQSSNREFVTYVDRGEIQEQRSQALQNKYQQGFVKAQLGTDRSKKNYCSYTYSQSYRPSNTLNEIDQNLSGIQSNFVSSMEMNQRRFRHQLSSVLALGSRWQLVMDGQFGYSKWQKPEKWAVFGTQAPTVFPTDAQIFTVQQHQSQQSNEVYGLCNFIYKLSSISNLSLFARYLGSFQAQEVSARIEDSSQVAVSLEDLGFGYLQQYQSHYTVLGSRYFIRKNATTLKSGLDFHLGEWLQKENLVTPSKAVARLRPSLALEHIVYGVGKFTLDYHYRLDLPDAQQIADGLTLTQFNSFRLGMPNLQSNETHITSLGFSKSNLKMGGSLSLKGSFIQQEHPLLTTFSFTGNSFTTSYINSNRPKKDILMSVLYSFMRPKKIHFFANFQVANSRFFREDTAMGALPIEQWRGTSKIRTSYNWKTIELRLQHNLKYNNLLVDNNRGNLGTLLQEVQTGCKVVLRKKWFLDTEFNFQQLRADNFGTNMVSLNQKVEYELMKNKFRIGIRGYNLLNQTIIPESATSIFTVSNTQSDIMGRFVQFQGSWIF